VSDTRREELQEERLSSRRVTWRPAAACWGTAATCCCLLGNGGVGMLPARAANGALGSGCMSQV
jgi:hypothetical protein